MPLTFEVKAFFCLVLLAITGNARGNTAPDSVRLFGNAPSYAGMNIVFERTTNFITRESDEVVRIKIDDKGHFDQTFAVPSTVYCTSELGTYEGFIYCEPGNNYELQLPEYSPKPNSEKFNPYFVSESIELGIKNQQNNPLNVQIRDFDEIFTRLYGTYSIPIFMKADIKLAQKVVHELDSLFPPHKDPFFENHRTARYCRLFHLAYKRQKRTTISILAQQVKLDENMPAYADVFNEVFNDFFLYYFSTPKGKKLRDTFSTCTSFDTLSMVMAEDSLFADAKFRELVLQKALYDAYYTDRYNKDQIEKLFATSAKLGKTPLVQAYGASIYKHVTKLKKGTPAPDFRAESASGRTYTLDSYKGKFVYLSFTNTQNYACKKDLLAMTSLARDFKKELEVVTITTDEDPDVAFEFEKKNALKFNFLHFANNGKVLRDYNVKAMPLYFLIDPDGNIANNPALPPSEEFIKSLQETIRNFKFKKARKSPDSQKSIYDL